MYHEPFPFAASTMFLKWTVLIGSLTFFTTALLLIVTMVEKSLNNLVANLHDNATLLNASSDEFKDDYR